MRILIVVFMLLYSSISLYAQKKLISHSAAESWPVISSPSISNDGKYFTYILGSLDSGKTLIAQSVDRSWKKEIHGAGNCLFTNDSRFLVFSLPGDSLGILKLGTDALKYIGEVESFKIPEQGNGKWLAYKLKGPENNLIVIDLQTETEKKYRNVRDFQFNIKGEVLLFQTIASKENNGSLFWLDLLSEKEICIGKENRAFKIVFDETGKQMAFISIIQSIGKNVLSLRYYKFGMDSAEILVDTSTPGIEGMRLSGRGTVLFSKNGDKIFFSIEKQDSLSIGKRSDSAGRVHVSHYKDEIFQFTENNNPLLSVMHLDASRKVVRLQQNEDGGYGFHLQEGNNDNYVVVESNAYGNREESKWRMSARPDIYLVSCKDGSRKLIKRRLICYDDLTFSQTGKYLIWYNRELKNWYTYNIARGTTNVITQKINVPLYYEDDHPNLPGPEGLTGWMEHDEAVLINDRYDVWRVDPEGIEPPYNITGSFGIKNNIRLKCMDFNGDYPVAFRSSDSLLLSAFDLTTKHSGFFKLSLNGNGHLVKLLMAPKAYYFPFRQNVTLDFSGQSIPFFPLKAKNGNTYLLNEMSPTEYPNLYITADFAHFEPLTELAPQDEFNWYNSELVHWRLFDGRLEEGVLYKPEDFDPKKKYPVVFFYYEKSADGLNLFINPSLSNGPMNIPWYVSNGYLVFVPDIHYTEGFPGQSAYNSVVSAAMHLSEMPWVNVHKMGLQGHSFGGFETNYIVTRTGLFAAAASAAGPSDFVSMYGINNSQYFLELSQVRLGATIWQKPGLYILNSPVFKADKVTTPLLIMHNNADGSVLWPQAEQWYSSLIRLGKKVWLLSYEGEGHIINDKKNQLDYSTRLDQFFDYYLKDALPPKWMTRGVPVDKTGIDDGFELDASGRRP